MISADNLGHPIDEIARAYTDTWLRNCSERSTWTGMPGAKRKTLTEMEIAKIRWWRSRGRGWNWIGDRLPVSCHTARKIANAAGID